MARILLIDDDRRVRAMMRRILAFVGHEIHEAEDGRQGLERFHAIAPALVISDIIMPEQEGMETIRLLRKEAPHLPILATSGGGTTASGVSYLRMAKRLGASAVLEKPFNTYNLISLVAQLLSGAAPVR